jgi:hypothetical protein
MRRRWVQWLSPPSRSNPGETLRWVRRIFLLGGVFALVVAGQFALQGESGVLISVLVVSGLLSVSTWVTLKPAIRRADEHGPLSAEDLPHARRRERRASVFTATLFCIAFPVIGYVLEGVGGAATFFVLGALSVGLAIWILRRRPAD